MEEAAVVDPAAKVCVKGRESGEAVNCVDAGQAELSAQEARVDLDWVVAAKDLPGQRLPLYPTNSLISCLSR